NLNHFRLLRVVGRGAFGKVRIVERKDTNLTFALKYIRKDEVDLMSGGDLRFHISRKTFTEEAVRFWIAELGCALRYVHSQNIIHRDVKPDNVLLDAEGHVHLTDFNVASDIVPGRIMTSKSGTLAYLAPEVYSGKGYDIRADWWSLGVLFYECIYNKRPFEGNSESSLSQQVQLSQPKYPVTQPPVSLTCLYAIRAALEPNPNARLGSTWESFIYNDFFKTINFDLLEQKRIEPIFVPSSDKTNFDATYDLEELLLEEAPLEARARRQKPRERLKEDATDQEIREDELYRMIETDFRPFDYTIAAYKKITGEQGEDTDPSAMEPQALTTDEATQMPSMNEPPMTYPAPPVDPTVSADRHGGPHMSPPNPSAYPGQTQYIPRSPQMSKRVTSPTGGVQVTLDGSGSWSELARQDATLPRDANTGAEVKNEGSGGMFGFLKSKKGRNNSPKPKERGVLGKEGARVVIS
ncbi:hypothetical protein TARUN_3933, partial [Trichoderma arundinaceum]